jgi:hypothetical protein
MQALIISMIANIMLGTVFLLHYGPKIIQSIRDKKKLRETHLVTKRKEEIRQIVIEYLEELKNE